MNRFYCGALGLLSTVLLSPLQAADCQSYVGQKVTVTAFEPAIAKLPKVPQKDEFETTAQYETRLASIQTPTEPIILAGRAEPKVLDGDTLMYDADKGTLSVNSAFFGYVINHEMATFTPDIAGIKDSYKIHFQLREREVFKGRYKASNAYGASMMVQKLELLIDEVFERGLRHRESQFASVTDGAVSVGSVPMPPDVAKLVKTSPRSAFVVVPKAPYFATGTVNYPPTRQVPFDSDAKFRTIIADIQCAMVLDSSSTVRASFDVK